MNLFESESEKEVVRQKGLHQDKTPAAIRLGKKFHAQILSAYTPKVSVRWIDTTVGYGLFAEEVIDKNQYVGEYTGVVRQYDRRYFEPLNNYCYEYPVCDDTGRHFVIDATAGCLTRFINHSYAPNLQPSYAYWEGFYHLIFTAKKKIAPGEQLSFDYGESYWYLRDKPVQL
jgi:SET domain-containing protein